MKLLSFLMVLLVSFEAQAQRSEISPASKETALYCQKRYPNVFNRKRMAAESNGSFQSQCCSMNPYNGEVGQTMNYKLSSFHYDVLRSRKEKLEDAYGQCLKSRIKRTAKAGCGEYVKARDEYCKVFNPKRHPESVCFSEKGYFPVEKCVNPSESNTRVSTQRVKAPKSMEVGETQPQTEPVSGQKAQ